MKKKNPQILIPVSTRNNIKIEKNWNSLKKLLKKEIFVIQLIKFFINVKDWHLIVSSFFN